MVTKNKAAEKKGKVKVGKLNIKKETVKDLTGSETRQVRGGNRGLTGQEITPRDTRR